MLIREKVAQAKEILKEKNIDCWITFVRESQLNGDPILPYFLPADVTWATAIIFFRNGHDYVILGEYDKKMVEDLGVYQQVIGHITGLKEDLQEVFKCENPAQIAVNFSESAEICDGITHGMYLTLEKYLAEICMSDRIISAEPLVSALRERKTEFEIGKIREAIRHTEEIFDLVSGFIQPGKTELEVAEFMKAEVRKRGLELAWEEKVCPAVFTGPETAGAHYQPTERLIEKGHVLNMDFGVKVDGYCSDMQRTFYIMDNGETDVPEEVKFGFETLIRAIQEAKDAMRPGVTGEEIDRIARTIITEAGFPEFPHALGHGVGRFSHDGNALLGPRWEKYGDRPLQKLEPGMVFTIEPRLPVEGRGTVTIEEMVVVTETGAEWLSHPQKELILIK